MEYGVQVDNKFAFGSEDELADPSDLIKLSIQEKKTPAQKKAEREEAKKAKAKEEAEKKAAAIAAANKENRPATAERGRGGARGRGGRGRGDGAPRPPRTERHDGGSPPKDGAGEFRGGRGGRGRGGPRGGGDRPFRGRGNGPRPASGEVNNSEEHKDVTDENTPPKQEGGFRPRGGFNRGRGRGGARQFDRQSGSDKTGVRPQEKKEGHGKGNWGDNEDQIAAETEEVKVDEPETPPAPREKTAEELEIEAREAELAKMKTLAEYRATLSKDEPKFNTRKAGEGADENFGKLVPLSKKDHHDEDAHEVVIQAKESKKKLVETGFRFADATRDRRPFDKEERSEKFNNNRPERGRGGASGSGTPRGARGQGRGGNFGGRGSGPRTSGGRNDNHFKADIGNTSEFPSLA